MARALPTLPPVTDEHRRAAFTRMHWAGWTFEAAMADTLRARLVECRAHQLRKQQWQQQTRQQARQAWARPPHAPAHTPAPASATDCKRAAAGDRDD